MLSQSFFFSETESKTSHPVQAAVVQPSCEPLSASVSAPVSPSKPEEEQSPVDPSDITLSLFQTNSETEDKAEDAEAEVCEEMVVSGMEYEKKEEPEGHFEEETNGLGTEECEREQMSDRDVSNVVLSEKERQNEELNEKDNCSASSISSASSTLEREEREEKHVSHSDSGENIHKSNTVHHRGSNIRKSTLFLYYHETIFNSIGIPDKPLMVKMFVKVGRYFLDSMHVFYLKHLLLAAAIVRQLLEFDLKDELCCSSW